MSKTRPKVLQVSHACDPYSSMEARLSWHRAVESAKEFDTWVICQPSDFDSQRGRRLPPRPNVDGLTIHEIGPSRLQNVSGLFYAAYHKFQCRAYEEAVALHESIGFDLTHQVSFCGYREPSYLWKIDVPFVWGPIGGTQNFPAKYFGELQPWGLAKEFSRNILNGFHLRYRSRVRHAVQKAAYIFAANSVARRDLLKFYSFTAELQLETGIDELPAWQPRERGPDEPLRILWAGRFCPWKAMPLLLKALSSIRNQASFEVRALGYGPKQKSWDRLIDRYGLRDRAKIVGWPPYKDSLRHYEWADVFSFTSLRDTSGTGLLEALSYGCPIIGVDHQGAHDIIDESCGIKVSVDNPVATIDGIAKAILRLDSSPQELATLSLGARNRAKNYLWSKHGARMREVYHSVLADAKETNSNGAAAARELTATG